jgi:hypothetical protein
MESAKSISIDVLRKTLNGIFDFIEKDLGITEVELRQNHYWSVTDDERYSMEDPPKELGVGSLIDDWDFVLSASKSDQQIPIDLIHIAPLLQVLSHAVPSYTAPRDSTKKD